MIDNLLSALLITIMVIWICEALMQAYKGLELLFKSKEMEEQLLDFLNKNCGDGWFYDSEMRAYHHLKFGWLSLEDIEKTELSKRGHNE